MKTNLREYTEEFPKLPSNTNAWRNLFRNSFVLEIETERLISYSLSLFTPAIKFFELFYPITSNAISPNLQLSQHDDIDDISK